jgi:hydroxypyruvate isomerase
MRFSANIGFLFRELALPDAIRAAKRQGFDAVEMHWPYDTEPTAAACSALNIAVLEFVPSSATALPGNRS